MSPPIDEETPPFGDTITPSTPKHSESQDEYIRLWKALLYANPYGTGAARVIRIGLKPGVIGPYPKPFLEKPAAPPPR